MEADDLSPRFHLDPIRIRQGPFLAACRLAGIACLAALLSTSCESDGRSAPAADRETSEGTKAERTSDRTPGAGQGSGEPPAGEFSEARRTMVERLERVFDDDRVLRAMGRIPRHEFVPPAHRARSYEDGALRIAGGQSMYGPSQAAQMASLLELEGRERVLEVGTGTGYLASVLAELAQEVWTIEILPELSRQARERVEDLRKRGVLRDGSRIEFLVGDGAEGWPDAAPYDAIVLAVAASEVPVQLINQLRPGGRLVVPVGKVVQKLQVIRKSLDGTRLSTETHGFVRFDPLQRPAPETGTDGAEGLRETPPEDG